jgi:hypothetical protein
MNGFQLARSLLQNQHAALHRTEMIARLHQKVPNQLRILSQRPKGHLLGRWRRVGNQLVRFADLLPLV